MRVVQSYSVFKYLENREICVPDIRDTNFTWYATDTATLLFKIAEFETLELAIEYIKYLEDIETYFILTTYNVVK